MFIFQVATGGSLDALAIIAIAAAVVALTQLLKWAKIVEDKHGPILVLVLAAIGVGFWGWSNVGFSRALAFAYFAGWIAVATSAAGVYGFTRSIPEAITATSNPPSGAGSDKTTGGN